MILILDKEPTLERCSQCNNESLDHYAVYDKQKGKTVIKFECLNRCGYTAILGN